MTFRIRLLLASTVCLFVAAGAFAQCSLTLTATEQTNAPGIYDFQVVASGRCMAGGRNGGEVRLTSGGYPSYTCVDSPCLYGWSQAVICDPLEVQVEATCLRDTCDVDPVQAVAKVKVESNHQPTISEIDSAPYATIDGGTGLSGHLLIHAQAAWTDRVLAYQWLPDLIDAGTERVGDLSDDVTVGFSKVMPAGQQLLKATIWACGDEQNTVVIAAKDNTCCCQATPTAPPCFAQPISAASGNMRMADADPLPSAPAGSLTRTYDSSGRDVSGRFGKGWTSFLDRLAKSASVDGGTYVTIRNGEGTTYVFRSSGGAFVQAWPRNGIPATLAYDGAAGTYTLHEPQRDLDIVVRASDGLPLQVHSRASRRDVTIAYSGATPTHVADSWGNWGWTLTVDEASGRITAVTLDGTTNSWQYTYDGSGQLTTVRGPNNSPWRTYTYVSGGMSEARDAAGRLIESHTYDLGRANSSISAEGDVIGVNYGLSGEPGESGTRVTYATGATTLYYTAWIAGRPRTTRVVGSCSGCGANDAVYAYDAAGNIVREQDARGYVSTRTFDAGGRVTSLTAGYRPATCDPETDANHCRFTSQSLAAAALQPTPEIATTTYAYGDSNWPDRPTAVTTKSVANPAESRVASYTYDAVSGAVLQEQIDGWKNGTDPETIVSTTTLYDGLAVAPFNPGGTFDSSWLTLPQPAGMRRSFDGPRTDVADVTQWVYYPVAEAVPPLLRGHLAAIRDAVGNVTRFEAYDAFGHATRTVDANGVASESTYDDAGRLLTTTLKGVAGCDTAADPLCATDIVTQRAYDPVLGPLASETRPNGGTTTYEYDDRRRMTAMTRAVSAAVYERAEYDYDTATGKRSAERYKSGAPGSWTLARSEAFAYDIYARLREIDHPDGSKIVYTYDAAGNVHTVQDERHSTPNTTYGYDPLNRLASVRQTLSSAAGGSILTQYAYDVAGNLVRVTDPNGNETAYSFDDVGRTMSQTSPVTGTTAYAYDAAGNLTSMTDANGAITTRTYDAANRVLVASSSRNGEAEEVEWSYDAPEAGGYGRGRVATMNAPDVTQVYKYERRGMLRREELSIQGEPFVQSYGYDADGNRAVVGYPSGRVVNYVFDLTRRPTAATGTMNGSETSYVTSASYLPFGPLKSLDFANGAAETRTFNTRYLPATSRLSVPGGVLANSSYVADAGGNITQITDLLNPGYSRTFGYDDLNRLFTANSGSSLWGSGGFSYDAMGNMLTATLGNKARSFTYVGSTPLINTATDNGVLTQMQYDAAGNELTGPAAAASNFISDVRTYSPRNLLSQVDITNRICIGPWRQPEGCTGWGASTASVMNVYDGRGLRAASLSSRSIPRSMPLMENYFYTPQLQPLATLSDAVETDTILFAGRSVAAHSDAALLFTFTDHLGTPLLQMDAAGTVVWQVEYEPYGEVSAVRAGSASQQPLRFPGQQVAFKNAADGEESYNIFRWYRSGWGRYTQPDPIGLRGGTNLLAYGLGNPIRNQDPFGLRVRTCCKVIPATLIGKRHCYFEFDSGSPKTIGYHFNNEENAIETVFAIVGLQTASVKKDHGFDTDPGNPGTCGPWSQCGDACVQKAAAQYGTSQYFLFGPNSNTFASSITYQCGLTPPNPDETNNAPGWSTPPPQVPYAPWSEFVNAYNKVSHSP